MIRTIFVRNYTCLPETSFETGSLNVFYGPTGTGKTALLSAVESLLRTQVEDDGSFLSFRDIFCPLAVFLAGVDAESFRELKGDPDLPFSLRIHTETAVLEVPDFADGETGGGLPNVLGLKRSPLSSREHEPYLPWDLSRVRGPVAEILQATDSLRTLPFPSKRWLNLRKLALLLAAAQPEAFLEDRQAGDGEPPWSCVFLYDFDGDYCPSCWKAAAEAVGRSSGNGVQIFVETRSERVVQMLLEQGARVWTFLPGDAGVEVRSGFEAGGFDLCPVPDLLPNTGKPVFSGGGPE